MPMESLYPENCTLIKVRLHWRSFTSLLLCKNGSNSSIGESLLKGRIKMINLLVLASIDKLHLNLVLFTKEVIIL
jgi:hypothetical protein